jgi:hypothetical protein
MKLMLFLTLFCLPAFAQEGSGWVRSQFTDKLTGDLVASYQLLPQPDGSGRKPYIGITCDQTGKRFTYGYFTDEMVHINAEYASLGSMYYPTTVEYRADSSKVRRDSVTVRSDFRTINIDGPILSGLSASHEFAISYPSERGYMVTDVFASGPLPASYAGDCYTEKIRRKQK